MATPVKTFVEKLKILAEWLPLIVEEVQLLFTHPPLCQICSKDLFAMIICMRAQARTELTELLQHDVTLMLSYFPHYFKKDPAAIPHGMPTLVGNNAREQGEERTHPSTSHPSQLCGG